MRIDEVERTMLLMKGVSAIDAFVSMLRGRKVCLHRFAGLLGVPPPTNGLRIPPQLLAYRGELVPDSRVGRLPERLGMQLIASHLQTSQFEHPLRLGLACRRIAQTLVRQ